MIPHSFIKNLLLDGIDTAIYDWWLADPDLDVYEHFALALHSREEMEREWDFWREPLTARCSQSIRDAVTPGEERLPNRAR